MPNTALDNLPPLNGIDIADDDKLYISDASEVGIAKSKYVKVDQLFIKTKSYTDALYSVLGHLHTGVYAPLVHTHAAAGLNTQIQFNDAGAIAGNSNFTFDKATNTLATIKLNSGNYSSFARIGVGGNATQMNFHAFEDWVITDSTASPNLGYASYDAQPRLEGTANNDHFIGFQSRLIYNSSGTIDKLAAFTAAAQHIGTGLMTQYYGMLINDITGTGPVTNSYGLKITSTVKGTVNNYCLHIGPALNGSGDNYGLYSEAARNRFLGNVSIGSASPSPWSPLTFGANAPNVASRFALYENPADGTFFRGIAMTNPSSFGVGIYGGTGASLPTDTNMDVFITSGAVGILGLLGFGANAYTIDIAAGRNAAGIMEVNSGVAGTYRDLKLREIFATGAVRSNSPTSGIGYSVGAGGTIVQATNKSTGVTLNTVCGTITMNAAALAADTAVSFTLTNSAIAAGDRIILQHDSVGTSGAYLLNAQCAAGSAVITVRNISTGSLSEAIVIGFAVIKGVVA
jgi:hypothetical protein